MLSFAAKLERVLLAMDSALVEAAGRRNFEPSQVNHKYNLLTRYDDALLGMSEVEGTDRFGHYDDKSAESWLNSQNRPGQYTAAYALEKLKHMLSSREESAAQQPGYQYDGLEHVSTIYGNGGVNRWDAYLNGMVYFSSRHADSDAATKRASELGFEIR